MLFGIKNDIGEVDVFKVFSKVENNSEFSLTYFILLLGSSIICTLGLLLNASAVVIGGMIIAPFMWPLVRISLGLTYEQSGFLKSGLIIIAISIFVGVFSAFIITTFSPLKQLNQEILARTTPTLLDLGIALVAGVIAALAIVKTKVSDNLAGVAIASSLMPPLCVSGIGLALSNYTIFFNALLLFVSNVESIIFSSILVFYFLGINRYAEGNLRRKGFMVVAIGLFITAIPLFILLRNFSFKAGIYSKAESVLTKNFGEISSSIYIDNVKTNVVTKEGREVISVEAIVFLPEDVSIDYKHQQSIVRELEEEFNKPVDMNLVLQKSLAIVTEQDIETEKKKSLITEMFLREIGRINETLSVDSFNITFDKKKLSWVILAIMRGDPAVPFTYDQQKKLEDLISKRINQKVVLTLEIISRVKLQSKPELQNKQIEQEVEFLFNFLLDQVDIKVLSIQTNDEDEIISMELEVRTPRDFQISRETLSFIKDHLENKFKKPFSLRIIQIEKEDIVI